MLLPRHLRRLANDAAGCRPGGASPIARAGASLHRALPHPWRQAVDLANMMLCLALRSSAQRVYQRALRQFTVEEISEGFAAARGLALPSQLRRMLREQGRDLQAESLRLLPARPHPIRIQRWSARRVGLLLLVVVPVAVLLIPHLGAQRYERTDQSGSGPAATWHTVFPGGCVTAQLQWTSAADAGFASEARSIIDFTTRQALQQALEQRSGGRLHLDPLPG